MTAYARNNIIPKKLGVEATPKNLNDLKLQNQHADKVAQENYKSALALAKIVENTKVVVKMRSGEGGRTSWLHLHQGDIGCGKGAAWLRARQEKDAA